MMTRGSPLGRPSKAPAARRGRITLASRFTLSGQVRAVVTVAPGPLTVTGFGANPSVTVITRVQLSRAGRRPDALPDLRRASGPAPSRLSKLC